MHGYAQEHTSRYIDIEDIDTHISVAISVQAVVFFSHVLAMGWTKECQARRFAQYRLGEWVEWANSLPPEGFGRYTKDGWKLWILKMANDSGKSAAKQWSQIEESAHMEDQGSSAELVLYLRGTAMQS